MSLFNHSKSGEADGSEKPNVSQPSSVPESELSKNGESSSEAFSSSATESAAASVQPETSSAQSEAPSMESSSQESETSSNSQETSSISREKTDNSSENAFSSSEGDAKKTPASHSFKSLRFSIMVQWVVLLLVACGVGYVFLTDYRHSQSVAGYQSDVQKLEQETKSISDTLSRNAPQEMAASIASQAKAIKALQDDNEIEKRYYSQRPLVGDDVLMYEIEYRVRFAEQQLMVGNADIALEMLKKARADLSDLKRLDLATVKMLLDQNIKTLSDTPAFDGQKFITRIDTSLNAINGMPPYLVPTSMTEAQALPPPVMDGSMPTWQRWWTNFKAIARSIIRVHVGAPGSRTAVIDVGLDKQELRLRLLSLRLMVIVRNPEARTESIALNSWVTQRFDDQNADVKALETLLTDISASAIVQPLPNIQNTIAAIRKWRAAQR